MSQKAMFCYLVDCLAELDKSKKKKKKKKKRSPSWWLTDEQRYSMLARERVGCQKHFFGIDMISPSFPCTDLQLAVTSPTPLRWRT
jgi:hypothetical protein